MKSRVAFEYLAVVFVTLSLVRSAAAIDEYQWNSTLTGARIWQLDGNWSQPNFPNAGNHSAVISVASDLTLDIGSTDVAVAVLHLNPTSGGTDINLTSSGGRLLFQNDDNNIGIDPAPGNADVEDILQYEGVNLGRVYVTSNGTAGSTNTISAPIRLANNGFLEGVDFLGTQSIALSGPIDIVGAAENDSGQLRSYLPTGTRLNVTGAINLTDAGDNTTARFLVLNNYYTTDHGTPPRGTIELSGPISGAGGLVVGWTWDVDGLEDNTDDALFDPAPTPASPFGTVIISGNNSFTGNVVQARGNLVVGHNNALGTGTLSQGGPAGDSKEVGYDLISTSDDRVIANNVNVSQWLTIKGAGSVPGLEAVGDHSIKFSGRVITTNSRGWVNLLPDGKTLTLSGPQYALEGDNANDPYRVYTVDGSGRTLIVGGMHNRAPGDAPGGFGHFRKRGEGTVVIDYDDTNVADTPSDYGGHTYVESGNLHYATESDLPDPSTFGVPQPHLGQFMSSGGAVGLDSGTISNATFLGMLNNSSNPNANGQNTFTGNYFLGIEGPRTLYSTYDAGGLMLAAGEYNQNLNFNSGNLANAANMTLAAWETGSTYTGTITPSTTVTVNANTYQLGGGAGTLTLPNNNQLTGSNALLVTNGGEVALTGTHNYTGKTRITGKYHTSLVEDAIVGTADSDGDGLYEEERQATFVPSTLTVSNLGNAGVASGLGSFASSTDVTGLTIQGSRLKYVGAATSTNRLFTVGTAGATLDSSGTGEVNFSNTAALGIDIAENRTGVVSQGGAPGNENNEVFGIPKFNSAGQPVMFSTEDLVVGMRIQDVHATPQLEDDLEIKGVITNHAVEVGERELAEGETPWIGITQTQVRTFKFGPAPARFLTLSGSNTGNNTLAPLVGNASDIGNAVGNEVANGYGTVGIHKTGVGKWILTGNNTYTGATNVDAGTLLINGAQTGNGLTTVASGATFGGTGQIGGGLKMLAGSTLTAAFSGGALDALAVLGNVDLSALGNILNVTGSFTGSHTLLTYTGTLTGTFEATPGVMVNYGTGTNSVISITISEPVMVGDYNNDGKVDAADYTVWRDNLGGNGSTLGANRDPSNGGVVSIADYNSWKNNFGAMAGSGGLAGAAVPEPGTCLLLGIALVGFGLQRRRG